MRCGPFTAPGTEASLWGLLLLMTGIPVWFGMRLECALLQPGAGGRSSRASGISRLSFCAKDLRQTSLLPNGPAT